MKGAIYLGVGTLAIAIAVLCGGCVTLDPAVDFVKGELAANNINVKAADIQKAMGYLEKANAALPPEYQPILSAIAGAVDKWEVATTNVPAFDSPEGALYAGFLLDDAKIRVMNKLSVNANGDDYTALLKQLKDFGFNQILLSLCNQGDGGPVPTTFYRDAWFGDVDPAKVAMMRERIIEAKAAGFAVELWGPLDDSPALAAANPEQLKGLYDAMVTNFNDLADSWCVGLEIDEWGKKWWNGLWHKPDMTTIQGCVEILKATGKPTAIHLTSYKEIDLALQSGADTFNAQFGWQKSVKDMTQAMAWINERKGNLRIVATEFNRDSITPLATALATEAMRCGAVGTQTGRPM